MIANGMQRWPLPVLNNARKITHVTLYCETEGFARVLLEWQQNAPKAVYI